MLTQSFTKSFLNYKFTNFNYSNWYKEGMKAQMYSFLYALVCVWACEIKRTCLGEACGSLKKDKFLGLGHRDQCVRKGVLV